MSLLALAIAYHMDVPAHSGPLFDCCEMAGRSIIDSFSSTGSGLMVAHKPLMENANASDAPLSGFEIAGEDYEWKWATAKIIARNQVEVFHKSVPDPVAVRYAWQANPEQANLYNIEGLPASLFRFDR